MKRLDAVTRRQALQLIGAAGAASLVAVGRGGRAVTAHPDPTGDGGTLLD